ncbi:hypothetical protein [Komagataeibacter medellinensis]|uniref:hypothetical protein n=1 Tax=Komagataeibacter medellinensis TaxID=1177712 RepID=UPI001298170B|nr:hypothetical protein [Komagataeibacter medellinensis]
MTPQMKVMVTAGNNSKQKIICVQHFLDNKMERPGERFLSNYILSAYRQCSAAIWADIMHDRHCDVPECLPSDEIKSHSFDQASDP